MQPLRIDITVLPETPLPVDLALIKAHCAIDDTRFDTLIPVYLMGAIGWAEGETSRTIFQRTHSWVLRDFPRETEIRLPRGKTQSVQSIQYVSGGATVTLTGPSSTVPGTDYTEDLRGDAGGIVSMANWPSVDTDSVAPVVINFTAGWASADVPNDIVRALLFAVNESIEARGGPDSSDLNVSVKESLISGWRLTRIY
jgi:uncharacterized phiE125 gp8 family phage protein